MISNSKRKNIQVVDGAENCVYDIFQIDEEGFKLIFPNEDQEVQFVEDIESNDRVEAAFERLWQCKQDRRNISGIHGTLFYEQGWKRKYFPTKKWDEIENFPDED